MQNNPVNYNAVFKLMPCNSIVVLPNAPLYTIAAVTNGMVNRAGLAAEQLINKPFFVPFPANPANPDDPNYAGQNLLLASFEHVLKQKELHRMPVIRYDLASNNSTFTEYYWQVTNMPVLDEMGNVLYILHTSLDVTEQVKAEHREAIMHGIETMHNLFLQTPIAISIFKGASLIIELANAATLALWGRGAEVIGHPLLEMIPEVQGQGYVELINEVLKTGKATDVYEKPVTLVRDGVNETLYINYVYQPFYEDDILTGVLAIGNDVTEKVNTGIQLKEKEKSLKESAEKFSNLLESLPQMTWINQPDGEITFYNKKWYSYTGLNYEQTKDIVWKDIVHPDDLTGTLNDFNQALQTGNIFENENRYKSAEGTYSWHLNRALPLKNENNEIIMWVGTATNIHHIKELERQKDDFLSVASHELKTPVTTIKAYGQIAETMLQQKGDTEILAMVKKMGTQVNKLTTLIEDLLNTTKIQKGKLVYNETLFDVNEVVNEVIDEMQKTSMRHKIQSNLDVTAQIFGDKVKIGQVLNNLISNAIKYSPDTGSILVTTKAEKQGIKLSVQDYGIGISPAEQQHVFEQFYRVTGSSHYTFSGMGIGLYICAEIITRHKGKIWVESDITKGSVFHVWLPFDYRVG